MSNISNRYFKEMAKSFIIQLNVLNLAVLFRSSSRPQQRLDS